MFRWYDFFRVAAGRSVVYLLFILILLVLFTIYKNKLEKNAKHFEAGLSQWVTLGRWTKHFFFCSFPGCTPYTYTQYTFRCATASVAAEGGARGKAENLKFLKLTIKCVQIAGHRASYCVCGLSVCVCFFIIISNYSMHYRLIYQLYCTGEQHVNTI